MADGNGSAPLPVRRRDIRARLESLGEARQASPSTARSNVPQVVCLFVDPQPPNVRPTTKSSRWRSVIPLTSFANGQRAPPSAIRSMG